MTKSERILLWSTAAATLVLRALAFFRYRFDSDEQQHLHVAWGWTAGLVQYRDVFDNHTPLFHLLSAPLLALLGERADILLWMRVPMLALFAIVLYATWDITRRLYDERVAAWAVVILSIFPPFFLKSLEYRTDNLWNAVWMLALLGLIRRWRPFFIGLLFGIAFAVSMKTSLLLVTVLIAGAVTRLFVRPRSDGPNWRARDWTSAAAGLVIIPALLAAYFVAAGAWDALLYCNVVFNGKLALARPHLWIGRAIFPFSFALVLWTAWRFRNTADPRRYFLAVASGVFTVVLAGFWLLISPRDFLPMMPLAAMFTAAAFTRMRSPVRAFGALVVVFFVSLFYYADRFENRTGWHITMMNQVLRMTRPGEMLLDHKGETIYRRRPFYYALEIVTRTQLAHGLIADTIPEDVVRTRTYVAQADGAPWPPRGRAFLNQNFLNMGRLRAAGQWIRDDGTFTIAIPGPYVVVDANGIARGTLDGSPLTAPRSLAAGAHRFVGPNGCAVMWAPAFERGHSPFHLRDTEF